MTIVAEHYQFVTGVDTHARRHQFAVLNAAGHVLEERSYPTDPAGIARSVEWARSRTAGGALLVSIDGAGSYGRLLTDAFLRAGIDVTQAPVIRYRPDGKDDRIDARLAASSVLPLEQDALARPRTGAEQEALQILLTARTSMTRERTATINALTGLLRRHDLGIDARRPLRTGQIAQIAAWRSHPTDPLDAAIARREATRLARRIRELAEQLVENNTTLRDLVTAVAPRLLDEPGVGPVSAATVYVAWSHPGRVRCEAAFARLAGVAPKPVSTGNHHRHRLDRTGDRRLNAALHRVVITRWRAHPQTLEYTARRRAEGRTDRDIRRALKRIVARQLFRLLQAS
ncbi:IS110 family transposase [Microbacterium oryzae]|uniref:IS110 family transposase n=1 Tax=Microbacterium oryzae TaxID=743009 RepID=A0A6I6E0C8_9MICO|nr:IS110 family transposase [Microbacterium oryzae]QGU27594.1 IS110 family transposase [Microbacterium oryzae]